MKKSGSGFTIVELLVVVVVIAILAAITIVSYNGITQQAQNTQLLGKVDSYTKAIQLYKIQNGTYPSIDSSETDTVGYACVGSPASFPGDGTYQANQCYKSTTLNIKASAGLVSQLRTVVSNLPDAALPSVSNNDNSISIRGILYASASPNATAGLQYVINGDQNCARGTKAYNIPSYPGMTICTVSFS